MPSVLDQLVCFAIYAAANATTQAYRQVLEPWGLTYPQYLTLVVLDDGALSVSALGAELGLDSGTVSPLLRRLEQRGLVSRERGGLPGATSSDTDATVVTDARVVTVALTASGHSVAKEVTEAVGCLAPAFRMSADDAPEVIRQLREATDGMKAFTAELRAS